MKQLISVVVTMAAAVWMAAPVSGQQSSWREIATPDFIVTGNAPTGELRRTLAEAHALPRLARPPVPEGGGDRPGAIHGVQAGNGRA